MKNADNIRPLYSEANSRIIDGIIRIFKERSSATRTSPEEIEPTENNEHTILILNEVSSHLERKEQGKDSGNDAYLFEKSLIVLMLDYSGNYTVAENEVLRNAVHNTGKRSLMLLIQCCDIYNFGGKQVESFGEIQEVQEIFSRLRINLDRGIPPKKLCKMIDDLLGIY